jgi:arylsulfatase A-like enzyme
MAEVLNSLGYKTAAVTCNELVNDKEGGILRGFKDVVYSPKPKAPSEGKSQEPLSANAEDMAGHWTGTEKGDGDSWYTAYIKEWLKNNYDGKNPFFIFLNCTETHHPNRPPQSFRGRFLPSWVTDERVKKVPQQTNIGGWPKGLPHNPEDWWIIRCLLDAATATSDHRLGIILDYLKEIGAYEDTLVFVTADHGDDIDEHRSISGHRSLYDASIHIPLIVKGYPEHFPRGTRVNNITQLNDIFATLIEELNIEDEKVKQSVQGYSLRSALSEAPKRTFAIAELWLPFVGWPFRQMSKIYRNLEYKYFWHSNTKVTPEGVSSESEELYDIVNDPTEQKNLAQEMPEKTKELNKELENFLLSIEIPPLCLKEDHIKRMIAWGYHQKVTPA